MKKFLLTSTVAMLLTLNTYASYKSQELQNANNVNISNGFADIVESLMPAVVNVYTTRTVKKQDVLKGQNPEEAFPFEQFPEFFEKFFGQDRLEDLFADKTVNSLGSGFIVDKSGYIVTNYHVIKDANDIKIKMHNAKELVAKIIGVDPRTDIALLKVDTKTDLPVVEFGNSSKSRVGDWVIAIGNPFGLGGTVTKGIISAKARDIDLNSFGLVHDYIQTDAPINSGNSGGPMFDLNGKVIGVNTAIFSPSGGNVGIGFAIPSDTAQKVISELKTKGKVTRGMLNITYQPVTDEIAESLGLKDIKGALVQDVIKDGAGDKAGLKIGDIILKFNDVEINDKNILPKLVTETEVGKKVKMEILREGKKITLSVTIAESSDPQVALNKEEDTLPQKEGIKEYNGAKIANITSKIKQAYGLPTTEGVIVEALPKTSPWATKINGVGIAKGDVIVAVNQQRVRNVDEFDKIITDAKKQNRKHILFHAIRKNTTIFISVPSE